MTLEFRTHGRKLTPNLCALIARGIKCVLLRLTVSSIAMTHLIVDPSVSKCVRRVVAWWAEPEMLDAKLSILISDDTYDRSVTKITESLFAGWIEAAINHDAYLP